MNHNILHICSINTNGLQQPEKRQRLIQWSIQQQYIVNARNYFFTNVLNQLMQDFEGSLYQSHGTSNLKGWLFG